MSIRLTAILALLVSSWTAPAVAQGTVYDDELHVVIFEDLAYPFAARSARVEGDVVISVALNDDGSVKSTDALSGPRLLVAVAIDNARKWKFVPNAQRRAIIVYEFRIAGTCGDGARALFRLFHPNIASVNSCVPLAEVASPR